MPHANKEEKKPETKKGTEKKGCGCGCMPPLKSK
jgi:hypothetical protein